MYNIKGKCLEKLEMLKKPIDWVDTLIEAYKNEGSLDTDVTRNDFIYNFQSRFISYMSDEILQKHIFSEAENTTNSLTKKFRPFPELK